MLHVIVRSSTINKSEILYFTFVPGLLVMYINSFHFLSVCESRLLFCVSFVL